MILLCYPYLIDYTVIRRDKGIAAIKEYGCISTFAMTP